MSGALIPPLAHGCVALCLGSCRGRETTSPQDRGKSGAPGKQQALYLIHRVVFFKAVSLNCNLGEEGERKSGKKDLLIISPVMCISFLFADSPIAV